MALMVRKNPSAQSSRFVETMNQISAERAGGDASSVDDNDINFDDFGPSPDDDGPPLEPDEYEPPYEIPVTKPSTESIPLKKPLRKPAMSVKVASELETPPTAPALLTTKSKKMASNAERSRLYCDLSCRHHRRLKIASLIAGKSVAALLEGWIDEHCPLLPEP